MFRIIIIIMINFNLIGIIFPVLIKYIEYKFQLRLILQNSRLIIIKGANFTLSQTNIKYGDKTIYQIFYWIRHIDTHNTKPSAKEKKVNKNKIDECFEMEVESNIII